MVARLASRGPHDAAAFEALEARRKAVQQQTESLQGQRQFTFKQIGKLKGVGEDASAVMAEVAGIGERLQAAAPRMMRFQAEFQALMLGLPNLPREHPRSGRDERDNVEIRRWRPVNAPSLAFDFEPAGSRRARRYGLDFVGAKLSGARFVVMKAPSRVCIVRSPSSCSIPFCRTHYTSATHRAWSTPQPARNRAAAGFADDLFAARKGGAGGDEAPMYLIPTSEVSLTNFVRGEILAREQLPMLLTAHTPCFRSEAGSYGKDTRGMIRQHQFDKVEMVRITEHRSELSGARRWSVLPR
ncbi:MAG: aminoacyl--tRNA ligase-related protein [Burkholderiaceae bacterium]